MQPRMAIGVNNPGWNTRAPLRSEFTLINIAWNPTKDGWIKLNRDGASKGDPGAGGGGGVLHDYRGY